MVVSEEPQRVGDVGACERRSQNIRKLIENAQKKGHKKKGARRERMRFRNRSRIRLEGSAGSFFTPHAGNPIIIRSVKTFP